LLILGAAIVSLAIIIEIRFSWKWNASYFRAGIPIFVRSIERAGGVAGIALEPLEKSTKTAAAPPLAFRPLGPDLIAFREPGFSGYIPIMRGVLKSKPEEPFIVVAGLLNWSVVVLAIVLVAFLRRGVTDVAPYFLGLLAVLYFIQGVRFFRVGSALRGSVHADQKVAGA
jgi:Na+/H+ antiporter NhaD/arsenite permease-like protein